MQVTRRKASKVSDRILAIVMLIAAIVFTYAMGEAIFIREVFYGWNRLDWIAAALTSLIGPCLVIIGYAFWLD